VPILLDQTPLVGEISEYHGVDMRAFVGNHREEEVVVEERIPTLEGPSETRRVRKRVLPRPPIASLLMGGLELWEELGSIISGELKTASGRYDWEKVHRIISGEPKAAEPGASADRGGMYDSGSGRCSSLSLHGC
jgi:hypothetical protein